MRFSDSQSNLLESFALLEKKLAEAKSIYAPESKILKALERKKESLKSLVIEAQLASIDNAIENIESDRLDTHELSKCDLKILDLANACSQRRGGEGERRKD